ncbi:nucleoside diphosphate kinase 7, putative [Eimeria praecox]|uniref:Nucleoside diphosphate kinase 7, putative n=1 Tax=Eimeria praecox TaxID=51316 RepID=U6GXV8_9EIME|nr:nucleoside diphosphate kinase 7, putative [Eimeria praecox]
MEAPSRLAFYVSWDASGTGNIKELILVYYPGDSTVEAFQSKMEAPSRLAFYVSWDASGTGNIKELILVYYPGDSTVELRGVQNNSINLKRLAVPRRVAQSFYPGAQIVLFSRHLRIGDAANEQTAAFLTRFMEPAMCIWRAEDTQKYADAMQSLLDSGLILTHCRQLELDRPLGEFLKAQAPQADMQGSSSILSSSAVAAFLVRGENAAHKIRSLAAAGQELLTVSPGTPSETVEELAMELCEKAAGKPEAIAATETLSPAAAATGAEVTCCVIKPHALQQAGTILRELSNSGLCIRNMKSFRLTTVAAQEFLEIYNTVLKEFPQMVEEMTNGTVLAIQLEGPEAVARLRRLAGTQTCLAVPPVKKRTGSAVVQQQ